MNTYDKETTIRILLLFAFALGVLIYGCHNVQKAPKAAQPIIMQPSPP